MPAVQDNRLIITDVPALQVDAILSCLTRFMARDTHYRSRFLQRNFGYAFDGYSHYGQVDSTHQAPDDLLHSFVFSEFYDCERYPTEFKPYIRDEWPQLLAGVRQLEHKILESFSSSFKTLSPEQLGYMLSANYYPPSASLGSPAAGNTRLSEHPDVSLLTIFPFGIDQDFEYQDVSGQWHSAPDTQNMVAFPGYMLEWLSHGAIKALNHRVRLGSLQNKVRSSFAVFSLPLPNTILSRAAAEGSERETLAASAYFRAYTDLWDY
jgi:hypothetical protein